MKSLGEQEQGLRRFLAKAVAGTFGLQVANAGFAYVSTLLLARFLGAAGYGRYTYALAWLGLLTIPALLGLPGLITREISVYQSKSHWGLAKGLLIWANKSVFSISLALALLFVGITRWATNATPETVSVLAIAAIALPLMTLTQLRQPTMQALNRIVLGQLPELLVRPLLFISLLGGSYLVLGKSFTAPWAMSLYVAANGVAFLVGTWFLKGALPAVYQQVSAEYTPKLWLRSALPMLLIGGMYVINNRTDTIMLGLMRDQAEVGIYSIASQGSSLLSFVLIAFNTSLAPTFASLYSQGNFSRLQSIVTKSSQMILLTTLPMCLGLIVFGSYFLSLFGAEFVQGKTALIILIVGQFFNAATGSVALLLTMTNYERDVAFGVTASAVVNIILNAVLIPSSGLEGAAIATTVSRVAWNVLLVFLVYKRLGIRSTAFGKWI